MPSLSGLFYHPKSFFALVLLSFCLVALPLVVALVNAAVSVDRLFVQSAQAVYRAAQASQASRMLVGQVSAMERNARQYSVLEDPSLFDTYADRHAQFQATAKRLAVLSENSFLQQQLDALSAKEEVMFQELGDRERGMFNNINAEQEFIALNQLAQSILQESNTWIDNQVELLGQVADRAEQLLVGQAIALVPGTVIFAVFLSAMISRPVRQIDRSIRQLGDGEFEAPLRVGGPKDLQYLGDRLDWLRRRLKDLEEKKTNFIRHVSHELKTPLAAIREGAELLGEGVLGPVSDSQRDVVSILQRNSVQLQEMIENLINVNALETNHAVFDEVSVRLDQVLDNVLATHKLALLGKHIDVRMRAQKVTLRGDREKLRVILDNLVSNAAKYSPEGGALEVSLSRDGRDAVLDVVDSGPGIPPEERHKVFERFFRGSRHNGQVRGSGLGLSIAKDFVLAHHGSIEVVERRGPGAHFKVRLPLKKRKDAV